MLTQTERQQLRSAICGMSRYLINGEHFVSAELVLNLLDTYTALDEPLKVKCAMCDKNDVVAVAGKRPVCAECGT